MFANLSMHTWVYVNVRFCPVPCEEADDDVKQLALNTRPKPFDTNSGKKESKKRKSKGEREDEAGDDVKPKRLRFSDNDDVSEASEPEEDGKSDEGSAESAAEEPEASGSGSEDRDLFKDRFAMGPTNKSGASGTPLEPLEDQQAPDANPPWHNLDKRVRSKLELLAAELLEMLPASVCTHTVLTLESKTHVVFKRRYIPLWYYNVPCFI